MKGDFTRVTFRPRNHYSRVLQQQGRVQLDADSNEQISIDAHVDRMSTADLVGGCGAPCDAAGFALTCDGAQIPPEGCAPGDLRLEAGHYYVDGIFVEIEDPVVLESQPDLPAIGLPADDGRYLAYLDVWEEHLTSVDRPDIREVALGGPDTATRARRVWQVKLEPVSSEGDVPVCSDFGQDWTPADAESSGRLAAQAAASGPITDPCIIPPGAGFRRLENQLYRVEVHKGSQDAAGNNQTPTFIWSRDNGSVVLEVSGIIDTVISVTQPARDSVLGFATGDWVEMSDEGRTLRGEPGLLVELADAQGTELTVTTWNGGPPTLSTEFPTTVRRWDSIGEIDVVRGSWLDLEDGVQVQFENEPTQTYRTGDYWLIPARSADIERVSTNVGGDVEWPEDPTTGLPAFEFRHGIEHHYCLIATLGRTTDESGVVWTLESDCRNLFPALTDLAHLVYVGGDGQEAMPGDMLPQPLEVGMWNGGCAIQPALVRFATEDGGTLSSAGNSAGEIVVSVGPEAIASCTWMLAADWAIPGQRTRATLLDDHGNPIGLPIDFTANLSIASQVAFDPTGCDALAPETTVQDAIHHLSAASSLSVLCGDGQEAVPGSPLPQPLEVEVASACGLTEGAEVEFVADIGGRVAAVAGDLPSATATFSTTTGADGRASCVWLLDPVGATSQRVQVTLVSAPDGLTEDPKEACFTGQLSVATEVAYTPGCEGLAGVGTVQEALDELCANAGLYYVGGDGQEANPGEQLPHSLQVRVANGSWPSQGVKVLFEVVEGNGTVLGDDVFDPNTVVCVTDVNGIAAADWILGQSGTQRIETRLEDEASTFTVGFNAQFADGGGGGFEPGIRITDVRVGDHDLPNDGDVSIEDLAGGIIVSFDQPIDGRAAHGGMRSQPIMTVTVDIPRDRGDTHGPGGPHHLVVSFQPVIVRANLDPMGAALLWIPWDKDTFTDWLTKELREATQPEHGQEQDLDSLLAHLVLKGNFIWSQKDPTVFVDGDSFGAPSSDGRTEIQRDGTGRMSGDFRRGGDFEMWFWISS
jgi:hypothetical protein